MGALTKFFLVFGILTAVLLFAIWPSQVPVPEIKDEWWGSPDKRAPDTSIRPFKIEMTDEELADLKERIDRSYGRLSRPLMQVGFEYGFNTEFLKTVIDYWKDLYDWRKQEAYFNSFPHFKTNLGGLDIHFIHIKPKTVANKKILPLILIHGWPGSFVEFLKIIPLVTQERDDCDFVFEVVVPSLPGYGFSDAARVPGLGPAEMGHIFNNLMKRLGFDKYYVQGGDWGSIIGTAMATIYPQRIKGLHLNMLGFSNMKANIGLGLGSLWPTMMVPADKVDLVYPLKEKMGIILRETGYLHLQATKPDTVGVSLSDSPVGLAAYILEKFSTWTRKSGIAQRDGGLLDKFTMDELLNNIMVYWVSNSITSSMRLYKEAFSARTLGYRLDEIDCPVPMGAAIFPEELFIQPEMLIAFKFSRVLRYTYMERGGHFAAFEEPQMIADDLKVLVQMIENLPA